MFVRRFHKAYLFFVLMFIVLPTLLFILAKYSQGVSFSWANLGEFAGILSLAAFAATLVLAVRLPRFEQYFGSLNNQYRLHIFFGQLALSLALLHPLLLLARYASNLSEAIDFLWFPTYMEGLLYGFLSLMLFVIVVFVSLYVKLPYHIWRFTHKFAGLAFFLAYLHVLEVEPAVFESFPLLAIYMHLLSWVGLTAFTYQAIFRTIFRKYKLKVLSYKMLNDNVLEVEIEKPEGFNYEPGQFAFLSFKAKGLRELHPFSFVSSPKEDSLRFAIKKLGDYTSRLPRLIQNASYAYIEGPYGDFTLSKAASNRIIWIAGGVGITPFISFVSSLSNVNCANKKIHMIYCVNKKEEAVYLDFLEQKAKELDCFDFTLHESESSGFINAKKAEEISRVSDMEEKPDIFVCAPPAMIHALKEQFKTLGYKKDKIISEEFNF